jgi:hypothetical protein
MTELRHIFTWRRAWRPGGQATFRQKVSKWIDNAKTKLSTLTLPNGGLIVTRLSPPLMFTGPRRKPNEPVYRLEPLRELYSSWLGGGPVRPTEAAAAYALPPQPARQDQPAKAAQPAQPAQPAQSTPEGSKPLRIIRRKPIPWRGRTDTTVPATRLDAGIQPKGH